MSGQRLRLTTSRPAGYRRGGQVIGNAAAPTMVAVGDVTPEQLIALLTDPNIAIDVENKEGEFERPADEERVDMAQLLREELAKAQLAQLGEPTPDPIVPPAQGSEPDTAEPQGDGTVPDAEASEANGSQLAATADASDGSAADAGTTAPAQPETAAPAPEKPAPAKPIRSGKRKTTAV